MLILDNYKHNITYTIQKKCIYKISIRSMFKFASHQGINIRVLRPALHNAIKQREYAAIAGKSKIPKEHNTFDKSTWRNLMANHIQLITDFNLIYENPKDIRLYQIGTLITRPNKTSYNISQTENFMGKSSSQDLDLLSKPILVTNTIFKVEGSDYYFNQSEIKARIEENSQYKEMFNNVLAELKEKNIGVKVANKLEEKLTGYHILAKTMASSDGKSNSYLQELPITK